MTPATQPRQRREFVIMAQPKNRVAQDPLMAEALQRFVAGESAIDLADEYGCKPHAIYSAAKRKGYRRDRKTL